MHAGGGGSGKTMHAGGSGKTVHSAGGGSADSIAPVGGVLDRAFAVLYGNLPAKDRFRVAWLSGTLFFIMGGFWLLQSLKDPIVASILGIHFIPRCKMVSLGAVLTLVFIYNKLVDCFRKHELFYIIGAFYFALFSSVAVLLAHPIIGMQNEARNPNRIIGWVSYCAIESFGSICVSHFWSFVNASMDVDTAKSAFGLILAGANLGSIMGPTLAVTKGGWGVPRLYGCGAACMGLMVLMVWGYVRIFGMSVSPTKSGGKKKGAGGLEGLQLVVKHKYIQGIFALSCIFMVEIAILDYTTKKLAHDRFAALYPGDQNAAKSAFLAFAGMLGQVTNTIAFRFSLLGTSVVIRRLGLRLTLLTYPLMCLAVAVTMMVHPRLYVVFVGLMVLKGFSYSLNNPCKEILYQPTSPAIKFKSKSWIDTFGARMTKAGGSVVVDAFRSNVPGLIHVGGSVAAGCAAFLIWVAWVMGKKFDRLIETGDIVGGAAKVDDDSTSEALVAKQDSLVANEEGANGAQEGGQQAAATPLLAKALLGSSDGVVSQDDLG